MKWVKGQNLKGDTTIVEKVIERTEVIVKEPTITRTEVTNNVENPYTLLGENVVDSINDLPTDDESLLIDAKHIKNLPEPKIVGGGSTARNLYQLGDVNITAPTAGQNLEWNGTQWVNSTDDTGTINGSISTNQVAYGTAANTIGGNANFTYTAATNTLNPPNIDLAFTHGTTAGTVYATGNFGLGSAKNKFINIYDASAGFGGLTETNLGVGLWANTNNNTTTSQTGYMNTAIGQYALSSVTTGFGNSIVGFNAGGTINTGDYNTAVGCLAGTNIGVGNSNTYIGGLSYPAVYAGNRNTIIGYNTGRNTIADGNITIGASVEVPNNTGSAQLNIGNLIFGTGVYNSNTSSSTPVTGGKIGIGKVPATYTFEIEGDILATSFIKSGGTSSQFLKADGSVDSTTYLDTTTAGTTYLKLNQTTPQTTVGTFTFPIGRFTTGIYDNAGTPLLFINTGARTFHTATGTNLDLSVQNAISGAGAAAPAGGSIFFGNTAGGTQTFSVAIGPSAGRNANVASSSVFIGNSAGHTATNANSAVCIGAEAGFQATNAASSFLLGFRAGYQATNASSLVAIGASAGYQATGAAASMFLGANAGYLASSAVSSVFLGTNSGSRATSASNSVFLGANAGENATSSTNSVFLGRLAGQNATISPFSIYLGDSAGQAASYATYGTFLGESSGKSALRAADSIFIGTRAGYLDTVVNVATGAILTWSLVGGGGDYVVGDTISVNGGTGGVLRVDEAGPGDIYSWYVSYGGSYYQEGEYVTIDGGNYDAWGYAQTDGYGGLIDINLYSTGSGYFTGAYTVSGSYGYGATVEIQASNPIIAATLTAGGTGYYPLSNVGTTAITGVGNSAIINVLTTSVITARKTSIAIGKFSGTGGFSDSIAIGHGVKNSATLQANIGNVLFLDGIYNSDTQSSTPITAAKMTMKGGQVWGYLAKTANYTLTANDYTVNCTANSFNITLPTAVSATGQTYKIKNSGTGNITILTTSSQTIDGKASGYWVLPQYVSMEVMSNGANWIIN